MCYIHLFTWIEKLGSPDLTRVSRIGLGNPRVELGSNTDRNGGLAESPGESSKSPESDSDLKEK